MANRRLNYRALARIERKGQHRAKRIADFIVSQIYLLAPYDSREKSNTKGPHLRDSYYVEQDPKSGDFLIKCKRRYWAYVEFGTNRVPGRQDARPHVRPAIEAARNRFG
jgi:hypothetical protein